MKDIEKNLDHENKENIITTGLRASFEKDDITVSEDLMAKTLARIAELDADRQAGGDEVNKYILSEEKEKVVDLAERRRKIRTFSSIAAALVVAVFGLSVIVSGGLKGAANSEESKKVAAPMFMTDTAATTVMATAEAKCEDVYDGAFYEESMAECAEAPACKEESFDEEQKKAVSMSKAEDAVLGARTSEEPAPGEGYDGEENLLTAGNMLTGTWSLGAENGVAESEETVSADEDLTMFMDSLPDEEVQREALTVSKTVFTTKQEMPDAEAAYKDGFAFFTREFFAKLTAEVTDGFISGELKDAETGSTVTDSAVYGQIKLIDISDTDYVLFSYILFTAVDENGSTVVRGFGEGKIRTADSLTRYMISGNKAELDEDYRGAGKGSLDQSLWEDVEVHRCMVPEGNVWEISFNIMDDTSYDEVVGYGLFFYYSKLFFDENGPSVFLTKHYCPDGDMDTPYEIYFVRDDKLIFTGYGDNTSMGDYTSSDGRYTVAVDGYQYDRMLDLWCDGALLFHDDDLYHGY